MGAAGGVGVRAAASCCEDGGRGVGLEGGFRSGYCSTQWIDHAEDVLEQHSVPCRVVPTLPVSVAYAVTPWAAEPMG